MRVLIFGGTAEARALAEALVAAGDDVTTSLAGRTAAPLMPEGAVHRGGFGGVEGLKAYLDETRPDTVVDATHPYAARMSGQIVTATQAAALPLIRLMRPEWTRPAGAAWQDFDSVAEALAAVPEGARALVTTGHEALETLGQRTGAGFLVRLIEPPLDPLPANAQLLLARPPFTHEGEKALMQAHRITHLITKNAGGRQTRAKIDAAAELGLETHMVARPALPPAREVASVDAALVVIHEPAS